MELIEKNGQKLIKSQKLGELKPKSVATLKKVNNGLELHKASNGKMKSLIIGDMSGSMSGEKMDGLKKALKETFRPGSRMFVFSSATYEIGYEEIDELYANGGTDMLEALKEGWNTNRQHFILATDGQPTDASSEEILDHAREHKDIPIDTIGIGDSSWGYDPEFLKELSKITGGRFNSVDDPLMLSELIDTLLLNAPGGAEKSGDKGGAIAL